MTNSGLYILTSSFLTQLNCYKFGMSLRLNQRWFDYTQVFKDPKYLYCYEFLSNNSKEEIFYIEKILLDSTKDKYYNGFSTEYRNFSYEELIKFHNNILELLDSFGIQYKLYINPVFPIPKTDYRPELLDEIKIYN